MGGLKNIFGPFGSQFGPEIRRGEGVGWRPRRFLWIRHCYIVTLGSLSSWRFQAVGLDRSSPLSFFPFGFPSTSMELQHAGKKTQMKKKIESSSCFQVLYKGEIRKIRFVLVECWQRNIFYKKSVMHVQCCCFADLRLRPL